MSKSPLQIQSFLANNSYRSYADWEMISAFCRDKAEFDVNAEINPEGGMSASDFIEWFEHGFGAGDVVQDGDETLILGICRHNRVLTVLKLKDYDVILIENRPLERLKMTSEDKKAEIEHKMYLQNLQFSWKDMTVIEKYIPGANERVIFHGNGHKGLGVIRDVDTESEDVELYCYFIYDTKR